MGSGGLIRIVIIGAAGAALAADTPTMDEELLFLLEERISVASRHEETTRDAPASVTVLTADDLARFGDRTVGEALERVAGWYVSRSHETDYVGVRGYNTSGAYNREVLVLLNGTALNESWSASAYVDEFLMVDVSLIDRIEVVSGPTSTLYGTNAFFGIINIVTKPAEKVGRLHAIVQAIDSGDGAGKLVVESGDKLASGFSYVTALSVWRHEGVSYEFREQGRADADTDRDRKWDLFAQAAYEDFSFQVGWVTREKRIPTAPYGTVFNDPRNLYAFDWGFAELKYRPKLSDRVTLTAQLSANLFEYSDDLFYDDDPEAYPEGYLFHDVGEDTTVASQVQLDIELSDSHSLYAGVSASRSATESRSGVASPPGDPGITVPVDVTNVAVYVQDELDLGKVRLSLGVRYDRSDTFDSSVSPRGGLIWHVSDEGTVKLVIGKGFRNPSPYEAFFDDGYAILPNPDLAPQVVWSYEAIYEHRIKSGYFVRGSVYALRGEDLFRQVTVNLGGIPCDEEGADCRDQITNAGETRGVGVEAVFEARPKSGVRAYGSVGYQDVEDPDLDGDFFNSPRWLAKAGLSWPFLDRRLYVGGDVTYVSERVAVDGTDLTVDPVTYLDLTVYAPLVARHVDLTLHVKNALDEDGFEPAVSEDISPIERIPQEGRSIRLQAGFRF